MAPAYLTKERASKKESAKSSVTTEESSEDDQASSRVREMLESPDTSGTQIERSRRRPKASSTADTARSKVGHNGAEDNHRHDQASPPRPYIPTREELERLKQLAEIMHFTAKIPQARGHQFDEIKLSGNARAVMGNAYSDENPISRIVAPFHKYGKAVVDVDARLHQGDTTVQGMALFLGRPTQEELGVHSGMVEEENADEHMVDEASDHETAGRPVPERPKKRYSEDGVSDPRPKERAKSRRSDGDAAKQNSKEHAKTGAPEKRTNGRGDRERTTTQRGEDEARKRETRSHGARK